MFDKITMRALLTTAAILGTCQARGASVTWQVSSGDWSVASNWGGTLPTLTTAAFIVNNDIANVTHSAKRAARSPWAAARGLERS